MLHQSLSSIAAHLPGPRGPSVSAFSVVVAAARSVLLLPTSRWLDLSSTTNWSLSGLKIQKHF